MPPEAVTVAEPAPTRVAVPLEAEAKLTTLVLLELQVAETLDPPDAAVNATVDWLRLKTTWGNTPAAELIAFCGWQGLIIRPFGAIGVAVPLTPL